MQRPELIQFRAGEKAKAQDVNTNFDQMENYVSDSVTELKVFVNSNLANLQTTINNFINSSVPTGVIQAYSGTTAPTGWLLCNGQAVNRTTYNKLFEVIGTKYGTGNGSTTFNIPDLRNKFIEGSTTAGTNIAAGLPNITGSFYTGRSQEAGGSGAFSKVAQSGSYSNSGGASDGGKYDFNASRSSSIYGKSSTVQPPALTMLYIIKT